MVPVDLELRPGQRGLAITGPNAGGKTVALKTLGLCALMAQAGLFIPVAEGSALPCFTAVLADIGDEQSIEHDLSTFTGHAANLADIARLAGPASLVLLDEPGAGTDPVEGAALAVGVLTDLLARGPLLVFTTHFPQVKTFALAEAALEVAAFDLDPATGAPRYHLDYHSVGQSLALPIARRHGLPARALEVAERLLAGESRDVARAVERLEASRRALDTARDAAVAEAKALARHARRERGAARRTAGPAPRPLERGSRGVARVPAHAAGRGARRARRAAPQARRRGAARLRRADGGTHRSAAGRGGAPRSGGTHPAAEDRGDGRGDRPRHSRRGVRARSRTRPHRSRRTQVRGPGLAAPRDRDPTDRGPAIAVRVERPEPDTVPGELNLVGQRARDAVDTLASFLDRAARAGRTEIRVVHGVGTGALRKAVQEFLASSPYCVKFHDADPQAGGSGVTVAELG